jgi:chromate transporter
MVVQEKTPPPRLLEIAGIMAREGSLTFGGGGPTTIALEKALVHGKGWLSRARFRLAYALSRFTPGTNVFAFCTALGWQMRGIPGAMVALIGASVPCSVVTIAITVLLQIWQDNPSAAVALQVASAVAIGLVAASCWPLVRPHVRKRTWARTLVLLGGAIALQLGGAPPIRVLLAAGALGALWREPS